MVHTAGNRKMKKVIVQCDTKGCKNQIEDTEDFEPCSGWSKLRATTENYTDDSLVILHFCKECTKKILSWTVKSGV